MKKEKTWRVEKMKLTKDKTAIVVNDALTLSGIPSECFNYCLGNRSALEWEIEPYQVKTDKRSGIVSDPSREDELEYSVRLIGRVVTVCVETVKLAGRIAEVLVSTSSHINQTCAILVTVATLNEK